MIFFKRHVMHGDILIVKHDQWSDDQLEVFLVTAVEDGGWTDCEESVQTATSFDAFPSSVSWSFLMMASNSAMSSNLSSIRVGGLLIILWLRLDDFGREQRRKSTTFVKSADCLRYFFRGSSCFFGTTSSTTDSCGQTKDVLWQERG